MKHIEICLRIVRNHQYEEVDDVVLDVQSASIILKLWEAIQGLGEDAQNRFLKLSIGKKAKMAWRACS